MTESPPTATIDKKRISVVIPVFRNKETVLETCLQILKVHQDSFSKFDLEVLFVDDGSADGTWDVLQDLRTQFPQCVTLIKLSRNFGQLSAILAGYSSAQGDAIITISADLQDPVSLMAEMVSHFEKGLEIVIAHRKSREDDLASTFFSRIAYGFARKANPKIPTGGFDYLLLSRRAAECLCSFSGRHRFFQGDVLWIGLPTTFIPYDRVRRQHGKSGWTFAKKFKYFTDLLLDSSYLPIRLMSGLGFMTASAGIVYAMAIVIAWFFHRTPFPGWAPIMVILLLIGGLIMMMLGIIGEYLWRLYDDIKKRPMFIIEKKMVRAELSEKRPSSMGLKTSL